MSERPKLTDRDKSVMALYSRSPHNLDGWATVSAVILPLVKSANAELFEIDEPMMRVRMTTEALILRKWL